MGFMNLFGGSSSRPAKLERAASTGTFEGLRNEYQFLRCQLTGGVCWHCQSITRDMVIGGYATGSQDRFYLCASHINDPGVCIVVKGSAAAMEVETSSLRNSVSSYTPGSLGSDKGCAEGAASPIHIVLSDAAFRRRSAAKNGAGAEALTRIELPGKKRVSRDTSSHDLAKKGGGLVSSVAVAAEPTSLMA